ncbi:hypothetical protein FGO68_gene17760 [Halteria grandinella]|uniref:Uncharacterized protein n=1 Tax=Halteria grandinella TaxID=5974 RepID=A0A8J8NE51_HALGN|nr:hypothetical protein FGO68_gene17760 [Halteria grandinella]
MDLKLCLCYLVLSQWLLRTHYSNVQHYVKPEQRRVHLDLVRILILLPFILSVLHRALPFAGLSILPWYNFHQFQVYLQLRMICVIILHQVSLSSFFGLLSVLFGSLSRLD